jgi:hypothetical protein
MAKIYCYGEDALTLWALNNCIEEILEQIQDNTPPQECRPFYRPSFGRGGWGYRSSIGEFDAILIARNNVYLIESKWDGLLPDQRSEIELEKFFSSELEDVKLKYNIFIWYVKKWSENTPWENFREEHQNEFEQEFPGKEIPGAGTLLAQRLEYILKSIKEVVQEHCSVKNVFLYFYREGKSVKLERLLENGNPSNFFAAIVNLDYTPALSADSNFILISQKQTEKRIR